MSPVAPRTVGLAVALTASLAAAAGLAAGALLRPFRPRRPSRAARRSIHDVPARPSLWDARPATGPILAAPDLRDISPVPPEDNHAPPTPPLGTPVQRG